MKFNHRPTAQTRFSNVARLEAAFGNLDDHFEKDKLATIVAQLEYSSEDERLAQPNPSPIEIDGNLRNGLATLKQAARLYHDFCAEHRSGREV